MPPLASLFMYLLIIIATVLISYFRTLRYGIVSDDLEVAKQKPHKKKLIHFYDCLRGNIISKNKEYAHLNCLMLHTLNCSLIYLLFGANRISFMAAMLFSINPANTQTAAWISGKSYSMYATLLMLCYKIGWFLPALIVSYIQKIAACGTSFKKEFSTPMELEISFRKLSLVIKVLGYYIRMGLFPWKLGMYHNFYALFGISEQDTKEGLALNKDFWIGLILLAGMVTAIIYNFHNMRLGLAWFLLCIIPFLNYPVISSQIIGERYAYSANIGLMLALSQVLTPLVFVAYFVYYLTRFNLYIGSFKDNDVWLEYNMYYFNYPTNATAALVKGDWERKKGQVYRALHSFALGLQGKPNDSRLNYVVSEVLYDLKCYKEALHHLKIAEKNKIDSKADLTPVVVQLTEMCKKAMKKK